jgi:hypothetical protein
MKQNAYDMVIIIIIIIITDNLGYLFLPIATTKLN